MPSRSQATQGKKSGRVYLLTHILVVRCVFAFLPDSVVRLKWKPDGVWPISVRFLGSDPQTCWGDKADRISVPNPVAVRVVAGVGGAAGALKQPVTWAS